MFIGAKHWCGSAQTNDIIWITFYSWNRWHKCTNI